MTRLGADLDGFKLWPSRLSRAEQEALRDAVFARFRAAPLYVPRMPKSGQPMRVRMTNFGALGWVTDKERGYRYQPAHPDTGKPWPDMPAAVLALRAGMAGIFGGASRESPGVRATQSKKGCQTARARSGARP